MGLYVETRIRGDLDTLWRRTQDPRLHQRWDLRFTEIDYLPRPDPAAPQRFRYATRVLPGLAVSGTGVSAGDRHRQDGTSTSALRFSSPHPLSLLAEGRGYWRYVPGATGIRFLTGYDYTPRWGSLGRFVDRVAVRPLMGWATAWSFDRLRLWCERGVSPERARRHALGELAARVTAGGLACAFVGAHPLTVLIVVAALALPPLATTPAARRCLRRRPGRTEATRARVSAPNVDQAGQCR